MALAVLLAITIGCMAWSLWIRRVTWACRWEVAATLNIALQALAILLMSPLASETVGHLLYELTGKWNLEDYLGHDAYIVAASAIVYNALGRLQDDDALGESFRQYVERPATLCIPLLLATFSLGNGAAVYRPDFFQVPTDFWLSAYWIVLCTTLLYLLGYAARAMFILRRDPRSRQDRQHLPLRVGERHAGLCGAHRDGLRGSVADLRGCDAGVVVRVHLRRRVRPRRRRTPGESRPNG